MSDAKYKPTSLVDYVVLIVSIVVAQLVGILGALSTQTGLSVWYQELAKPFFNPPSWVFGPVWTILYFLIGLAFYFIYKEKRIAMKTKKGLIFLFLVQLILNGFWTPVFFGMQNLLGGLIIIVLLDIVIIWLLLAFRKLYLDTLFYIWIPYVLWVLFATLLNASLYLLN